MLLAFLANPSAISRYLALLVEKTACPCYFNVDGRCQLWLSLYNFNHSYTNHAKCMVINFSYNQSFRFIKK